ncbi:hypothetical protein GGR51DRAFT_450263 [Nemania sp. FL0031]|nr:hypothetical protein GGR51DRAFT_450263 [Nemania sp. FL0031]
MELTPIRVRGKRRAGGQLLPVALPQRPRNRDQTPKKQLRAHRPKASNLERSMPLEILERIFWFSENVNFPRASLRLGRLLSGPSTLRETFLSAFGPTWEVWFGCIDNRGSQSPGVHSHADRFGGNPRFQSDLLACSWTTIDMILDCRDMWVRRYARTRPFEYIPLWGDPIEPSSYIDSGITVGDSNIKEARCYFYHDYNAFRNVEHETPCSRKMEYRLGHSPDTWIEVHRSAEIPDHLITGPWDEGSLEKFFWLVRAGAQLSPNQTWEVTQEGFRNAVSDQNTPNLTAVRLLRALGAFQKWPRHVRDEELRKVDVMLYVKSRNNITLHKRYVYIEWLLRNNL